MITHPAFVVEPWRVRESHLDLEVLARTESVFALANRHLGCEATWTKASRRVYLART
jgi:trehalose/maltose hydrolase-like predicted phosphorylase